MKDIVALTFSTSCMISLNGLDPLKEKTLQVTLLACIHRFFPSTVYWKKKKKQKNDQFTFERSESNVT